MTLPSFFAASISSGVIAVGGGAAAASGEANTVLAATAPVPLRTSRLENLLRRIARFLRLFLSEQRPAALGRQKDPHFGALREALVRRRDGAKLRAVGELDHIVAAIAEEDVARDGGGQKIVAGAVSR